MLSARFAAATTLTPVFGSVFLPGLMRVFLALVFGVVVALTMPASASIQTSSLATAQIVVAMLREMMIGAAFSLGFQAAYSATQVAGRILDVQTGFGVAGVLNPASNTFSPLLGSLYGMVGIALFLAMNGHHQLIRALALSAAIVQPGINSVGVSAGALLQQSGVMFSYGLMLAAPIMFALLLVDLALAVYARSLPQLNILVLSFAVKVAVGVMLLAVSIKWTQWTFERLYQVTFDYWLQKAVAP